jgi:hypothetical protein
MVNHSFSDSGIQKMRYSATFRIAEDPEQLRRLRLLYQYGAGLITAQDVVCLYPVPLLPEKAADNKLDPGKTDPGKTAEAQKTDAEKPRLYIRGEFRKSCYNIAHGGERVERMFLGQNPDIAFLKPPGC